MNRSAISKRAWRTRKRRGGKGICVFCNRPIYTGGVVYGGMPYHKTCLEEMKFGLSPVQAGVANPTIGHSMANPRILSITDRYVTVGFSAMEVGNFKRQWPGSKLPDAPISFSFDKNNGDLVDVSCRKLNREDYRAMESALGIADYAWDYYVEKTGREKSLNPRRVMTNPKSPLFPVIFRKYPDGDIIALFPTELGGMSPYTCSSYMHVGQHGTASPELVIRQTKAAKPSEYADLLAELKRIGYTNIKVYHRYQHEWTEQRIQMIKKYGRTRNPLIYSFPLTQRRIGKGMFAKTNIVCRTKREAQSLARERKSNTGLNTRVIKDSYGWRIWEGVSPEKVERVWQLRAGPNPHRRRDGFGLYGGTLMNPIVHSLSGEKFYIDSSIHPTDIMISKPQGKRISITGKTNSHIWLSNPPNNPRPPAGWWAMMWPRVASGYPRKKKESLTNWKKSINRIVAGIWWKYPESTKKKLIKEYDKRATKATALANPDSGADVVSAKELALYAANTDSIYVQRLLPFIRNYAKKKAKGTYDQRRAIEGLANNLAKDVQALYWKEFGSGRPPVMNAATKFEFGRYMLGEMEDQIDWLAADIKGRMKHMNPVTDPYMQSGGYWVNI